MLTLRSLGGSTMADFERDTRVEGGAGRYRAELSRAWEIWGPMGGYVAAVALRAAGAQTALRRPASFTCQYLNVAAFEPVDITVESLRASRRAEALRVSMAQHDRPILEALVWAIAEDTPGLAHEYAAPPDLPGPDALESFNTLAPNYDEWYPYWRNVEGRPCEWIPWEEWEPGSPVWQTWMRFVDEADFTDPFVDAGRALVFLDTATWPAASNAHDAPHPHIAPNLDLSVQFHRGTQEERWLLVDGAAPIAAAGLIGCAGRLWTIDGRLAATSGAQLICRPNPYYEEQAQAMAERRREREES